MHPLTQAMDKACDIFQSMGFGIADGPELETEYYNFDALNIPKRPSGAGDARHILATPKQYHQNLPPEVRWGANLKSDGKLFVKDSYFFGCR